MCVCACSAAGGEIFNQCVSDREDEAFSEGDVKRLMRQILEGVSFLHQNNVVHLDLKVSGHTHAHTPSVTLSCLYCVAHPSPLSGEDTNMRCDVPSASEHPADQLLSSGGHQDRGLWSVQDGQQPPGAQRDYGNSRIRR